MVRQVTMPPDAQALSTLQRVDYTDAFVVDIAGAEHLTPEQWARAMIEGAPPSTRTALRSGWRSLGLRIGPADSDELVLGWELRRSTPDVALLGVRSHSALLGELLFRREQESVLFGTLIQFGNVAARAVWAGVSPGHRRVVERLLAAARVRASR